MSIRSYLMAKFYDATMRKMEAACLSGWRSELLADVRGAVLEIGSGTGANLPYYPRSVNRLVLSEPDRHMLVLLRETIDGAWARNCTAVRSSADRLDFPDQSFDAVVSTLVLCSVDSPQATLSEIKRVLAPGGKFYFIEHVLAKDAPHLMKWQKLAQPFWVYLGGNCHPTRDTEQSISNAGFRFEMIEKLSASGAPSIVSPIIKGIAKA